MLVSLFNEYNECSCESKASFHINYLYYDLHVMVCAIWYHLYNLKNVKNTHESVSYPFAIWTDVLNNVTLPLKSLQVKRNKNKYIENSDLVAILKINVLNILPIDNLQWTLLCRYDIK